MKLAVVVLHYETVDDTKACLKSLIDNNSGFPFDIVVVDNGSKHGKLSDFQNEFDGIHCIVSEKNLGFANGNNLGFAYAKNELDSDIIILANNDLIFNQNDFIQNVCRLYQKQPFDIAGPRVISLVDGMNQNPVRINFHERSDVKTRLLKFRILLLLNYVGLDTAIRRRVSNKVSEYHPNPTDSYQLHGACLLFGEKYINLFDGLFDGTFMYLEEDFLLQRAIRHNLNMVYLDTVEVQHKEGSSTNKAFNKPVKGRRFFYKWSINSLKLLLRYMKEEIQD